MLAREHECLGLGNTRSVSLCEASSVGILGFYRDNGYYYGIIGFCTEVQGKFACDSVLAKRDDCTANIAVKCAVADQLGETFVPKTYGSCQENVALNCLVCAGYFPDSVKGET